MPEVTITMDSGDLDRLAFVEPWSGTDRPDQVDRFYIVDDSARVDQSWRFGFWVGRDWSAVILVRGFLAAIGERYQIVWDSAEEPDPGFVVLANHRTQRCVDIARGSTAGPDDAGGKNRYHIQSRGLRNVLP